MLTIILVAFGGALGCVARFLLANGIHLIFGRDFPYGTFMVNCLGSFVMGILFVLCLERFGVIAEELKALLLIGFLGGFTTFSTFSIETINLIENGEILRAIINVVATVSLCLILCWFGVLLGRQL